ncbi:MAG: disulfide interchange protein CycY [Pseudomonadota bacterium]|jgi:cytochrome c biogenesis protein CcmG/thiol:disulfide interchange protein DsbE
MSDEAASRAKWLILPVVIFGALSILFAVQLLRGPKTTLPSTMIGKAAPDFTLPPLAGIARDGVPLPGLSKADLTGPVTLVNIFASWCAPCREEHPKLLELSKDARIKLVGINYKDEPDNARRFLGALGNPYVAIGTDQAGRAAIEWGVYGVPETFVISRTGHIAYKHVGPITDEALKGALGEAITKAVSGN